MIERPRTEPIRVALRIAAGPDHAFRVAATRAVLALDGIAVVLVVLASARSLPVAGRGRGLVAAYEWLERRTLRGGPSALDDVPGVSVVHGITVVRAGDGPEARTAALTRADPAVLVDLAPPGDDDLAIPPAGRWRLAFAAPPDGPRGDRLERPQKDGVAASMLRIERPDGSLEEHGLGVGALHRIGFSRDRDAISWRAATLPARHLARLVAGQAAAVPGGTDRRDGVAATHATARDTIPRPPFGGLVGTLLAKVLERVAFRAGWVVMTRRRTAEAGPPADLRGFEVVPAPPGRFYADPFVVVDDLGATRMYVEDCPDGTHHGRIGSLVLRSGGGWSPERTLLADLEHRAYPHVARTPEGLVMTPDGGHADGVDLFVDGGPGRGLHRIGRCLDGVAASDPTLLWDGERYWLFVAQAGHGMSPWDELFLYHAAELAGPWHAHPQNPVVADVRRARPGGRIFRHDGRWIRPGQDCSAVYGGRLTLNAITVLTPTAYEERPAGSVEPVGLGGVHRTHTYTFDGDIEALDGYRRVARIRLPGMAR